MSIVERALQQAKETQSLAADPAAASEAEPTAVDSSHDDEVAHSLSLTSRDLKAIVQIDFDQLRAAGRIPTPAMSDQTEEEIRRIKWPLLRAIEGSEGVVPARSNVVLVTSALPGEGKTFTSLNLALSIVRDREMRVVLVDGDVARPGLTPSLGLTGRPGLNDALEDETCDISSITYQTDVEGLFFVPAGKWNSHAPEYFAGSRMPQLMAALSRRVGRGVVIFDSPPLLATNEAQVATRFAGQVLIVVRSEETEQQAVLDAIALVDKDAPISAVLNNCKPSLLSRYYGQYYYGYGSHYKYTRDQAEAQGRRAGTGQGKGGA